MENSQNDRFIRDCGLGLLLNKSAFIHMLKMCPGLWSMLWGQFFDLYTQWSELSTDKPGITVFDVFSLGEVWVTRYGGAKTQRCPYRGMFLWGAFVILDHPSLEVSCGGGIMLLLRRMLLENNL